MIFAAFIWIPQHLHRGELGLTPRIQITVISSTSRPKIWVPSVPSVHLQAWLLWKWFHFAHWTLIELTSSSFATNIHFDYVFWVRNSVFSMFFIIFKPSTYQQTSPPVEPTSDCQVSPWVRLLRSWPNASSRISLEVSTAVIDATPGQWGWVRRGDWKQGLFEGETSSSSTRWRMWRWVYDVNKTQDRYMACLPSGKIMSNFGPMHLLNGADSQPKSCCPERIEGLPREIIHAQPLLNFPSLGEPFWY